MDFQKRSGKYINEKYEEKKEKLSKYEYEAIQQLRFQKAIAEIAKIIYNKNDKRLSIEDYREVCRKLYNNDSKLRATKLKRLMSKEIVKQQINSKLQDLYIRAGITEEEITKLYELAKEKAIEKGNSSDLIKLMEKVENAFNLHPDRVKTTRQIDFSEDKLSLKESKESNNNEED